MDLSELERLEAPAKVLKLSEAIRIGAKIRPQNHHGLLYDGYGTCALGSAAEARGWNLSMRINVQKAFLTDVGVDLWNQIGQRNDTGSTREEIADWLQAQGY